MKITAANVLCDRTCSVAVSYTTARPSHRLHVATRSSNRDHPTTTRPHRDRLVACTSPPDHHIVTVRIPRDRIVIARHRPSAAERMLLERPSRKDDEKAKLSGYTSFRRPIRIRSTDRRFDLKNKKSRTFASWIEFYYLTLLFFSLHVNLYTNP